MFNNYRYLANIKSVDAGIKLITRKLDAFFSDDRTTYIFTADHGMSNTGSHGDGNPDNTKTPLIAWGAGIAMPRRSDNITTNEYHHLRNIRNNDVMQADIAPLMVS